MKSTVESSVVSRSQSEANTERGKLDLLYAKTTKLDSLFHIYDQICYKAHLPNFIYFIATIYLYYQIFFSSIYPLNKYWFEVDDGRLIYSLNSHVIEALTYLEKCAWFFHVEDEKFDSKLANKNNETNLMYPTIVMAAIFLFSICAIMIELFGASKLHKLRKFSFYILRIILDIISPVLIIPASSLFGISIRNLVLFKDKLNWIYLFCGLIMYIIFIIYTYISLTILTHSTCITKTLLSTFNLKIPLFLPIISSLFVIFQCIFSLFNFWAMLIVQLTHMVISIYVFLPMIYLIFHTKLANIVFIGVTLSTWLNDIIFLALHIISPPMEQSKSNFHFFYISGLVIPLISLVLSIVASYFYVTIRYMRILNELNQLSEITEEFDEQSTTINNNEFDILKGSKLFKNENNILMSIHISFFNCLPLFYKWSAVNYAVSMMPTKRIFIAVVQYLSFFPGMSRKLNSYLKIISSNRDLNYHQRFLLFQIFHIKMMRQSSVSPDANRRLAELKNSTTEVFEDIYSFWGMKIANFHYLEMISNENWKLDSKWEDAIRDFPNYQKFCDEYCSYLIECQMDLERAIVMRHRAGLIEMGRNFTIDVPFKCLAKCVPSYIKKGIVDYQGSIRNREKETNNNNSANASINNQSTTNQSTTNYSVGSFESSGSSNSMLSSNYNLDPEFEETLGRQLFNQTALRLEMHRSLAKRKSYASILLLYGAFFVLICGIALLIGLFLYIDNYIMQRSDTLKYMNLATKSRFYLDLSVLGSTLKFAYFTNRFTTLDLFNGLDIKDNLREAEESKEYNKSSYSGYDSDMFHINSKISYSLIHRNCIISRDSFHQLIDGLCILGLSGESIYTLARVMMAKEVPFYTCFQGIPGNKTYMPLKSIEAYMHLNVEMSASKKALEGEWFNSDEICEILANQPNIELFTIDLFQTLMEHEIHLCDIESKYFLVFSLTFPFAPIVLFFLPILLFTRLFIVDTKKLINILLNASQRAKEEAKSPIRKESTLDSIQTTEKKPKKNQLILLRLLLLIFCCLNSLAFYFMLSETRELNKSIIKLGRWNLLSSVRMTSSIETMNYLLNTVILNGSESLNIPDSPNVVATRGKMIAQTKASMVILSNSNEALLKGHALVASSQGFDDEFDEINVNVACDSSGNQTDFHDSYRCSSASQGVGIYLSMIESILDDIENTGGNFDNELIAHSLHMLNRHLIARLEQAVDRLNDVNVIMCKRLEMKTLLYFILGLITNIITFIIILVFYFKSVSIYHSGMVLAQRLPPSTFLSDKKLLNFILHKKERKKESEMSTAQGVIFMSHDPIVCTNISGVVEIINPAVTNILGYTPDQMLGQHISTFFAGIDTQNANNNNNNKNGEDEQANKNDENNIKNDIQINSDSERIKKQLEMMKNGQSALVIVDHFICLTDNDQEMPCGVTILGMTNGNSDDHTNSGNVESYVLIIRDETQLMEQQRAAEAAKAQSENLLFQILPRDVVARLNSGEKDISFTVQSASVIFTDIVKFSEYASSLSPQEIMGSLSTLFASFDSLAKKYDLITKIKLIGDIYMAASGLFSEDISPQEHAEQILKFGLDCLIELDDVNLKLNSNLQLRVGVNSGGPLLAGVLGTDKPVFDIIGDTINVAARLQTTDVPGKVQIPKSTYDLVCDGNYSIEERGDVFLKGKGKTKAYLVSPFQNNAVALVDVSSSQQLV